MKNVTRLLTLPAMLAFMIFLVSSCSKEESGTPNENSMISAKLTPITPGTYVIKKFIDSGDDETAQFNGYKFMFKANGNLGVKFNGQTFAGSWDLNSGETMLTINISGTPALEDLDDDDWEVIGISSTTIKVQAPGPDMITFKMVQ